jgi:hypothetical protein
MVGVGFPERNDSFDFIAGLEDFKKQYKIAKGIQIPAAVSGTSDSNKFSLKEGEKISINIPGVTTGAKKADVNLLGAGAPSSGGGLKKLAPPPGSKKVIGVLQPQVIPQA